MFSLSKLAAFFKGGQSPKPQSPAPVLQKPAAVAVLLIWNSAPTLCVSCLSVISPQIQPSGMVVLSGAGTVCVDGQAFSACRECFPHPSLDALQREQRFAKVQKRARRAMKFAQN
jgi:hypothetical protein